MADGVDVIHGDSPVNPPGYPFPAGQCQVRSPFVLDISSDEEGSGLLEYEPKFTGSDDYDWLAELLRGESPGYEDSDEVVVVKEVNAKSKPKGVSVSPLTVCDEDDDDCVILDCDPDKPVVASDGSADDDASSDDLHVVGETGQVACRDYPHSRHLCVKFPFSSTSHEKHCNLCHCYVCDLPAPCEYWGTGVITDHCHATDKEELWRVCRKQSKGDKSGLAPKVKHANGSIPVTQFTPASLPLGPTRIVASSIPNNSIRILNPCSTYAPSSFSTGNVATDCTPRLHSNSVRQRLIRLHGGAAQRHVAHKNGCQLTPHSVSSGTAFKRFGPVRTSFAMNNNNQRAALQHARKVLPNILDSIGVQMNPNRSHSVPSSMRHIPNINHSTYPPQLIDISSHDGPSPPLNSSQICTQPPRRPVATDSTHGWSNDLSQYFQQPPPVQAFSGNGGHFQVCQPATSNEPNSHSAGTCNLTAAEIESWLLEDMPCEDINSLLEDVPGGDTIGTLSYNFGNNLGESSYIM